MSRTERFKPWIPKIAMLALAFGSSVGVYRFSLLFFTWQIALVVACSFELTYLGLAVVRANMTADARKQAIWLSRSAAGVAMLIVTLDGYFHLRPSLLALKPWYVDLALALVHGIPLPYIAYRMSNLLLHQDTGVVTYHDTYTVPVNKKRQRALLRPTGKPRIMSKRSPKDYTPVSMASTAVLPGFLKGPTERTQDIVKLWNEGANKSQIANTLGITRGTVNNHLTVAMSAGWTLRSDKKQVT
jgi:hypothetical protein